MAGENEFLFQNGQAAVWFTGRHVVYLFSCSYLHLLLSKHVKHMRRSLKLHKQLGLYVLFDPLLLNSFAARRSSRLTLKSESSQMVLHNVRWGGLESLGSDEVLRTSQAHWITFRRMLVGSNLAGTNIKLQTKIRERSKVKNRRYINLRQAGAKRTVRRPWNIKTMKCTGYKNKR